VAGDDIFLQVLVYVEDKAALSMGILFVDNELVINILG